MKSKIVIRGLIFGLLAVGIVYMYLTYRASSGYIVAQVRFPRLLLTFLTGFVLGGVGSVYQIMLNNPLAEPYILGVSSGAALGSVIAIILGLYLLIPVFAFVGALILILIVWYLAQIGGFFSSTKLLLSGIIAGMFCASLISLLLYLNQREIGSIIGVLMGNLGHIFSIKEWQVFRFVVGGSVLLMIYLFSLSDKLNILTSGDLVAASLGIEIKQIRRNVFVVSSLLVGVTVAYAGIIGFVGLLVPHIVRMLFGNDQRRVFLLSALGGAIFLILCDFLAMHLTVIEIPVGVITAFVGCPFFVYCFAKRK
ncbi:MAG: iron ABC transporter permease [Candidatus Cloacimonetes bacterium]|nr:iron ABC transporter permease [Candidatus Cloacimonadota bacterium]